MNETPDELTEAFSLLKACSGRGFQHRADLEERIMQEFENVQSKRRRNWTRITGVALVLIALVGVAVTAAGGIEAVKEWFATAEIISPDGTSKTYPIDESESPPAKPEASIVNRSKR